MKERQALKEDLEVTKTTLVNTQRLKNDLDADVSQLREKVTELSLREDDRAAGTQFTGFTSTKVQILTQLSLEDDRASVLCLLALLVQKYKY